MTRTVTIHEIELKPDADPAEFEAYALGKVLPLPSFPGWTYSLLKGDRGVRQGKYAIMVEHDQEARDQYFPGENQPSEEANQFLQDHPEVLAAMQGLGAYLTTVPGVNTVHTSYIILNP